MTVPRRISVAAGALIVAGFTLLAAPLSAAAHTGQLFTWAQDGDLGLPPQGFAHISQSDASMQFVGTPQVTDGYVTGADICDENPWAVGYGVEEEAVAMTWDHDSGTVGSPVPLVADVADFPDAVSVIVDAVWSADSLDDCTKLAYVRYSVEYAATQVEVYTVSFVDLATGAVTPIDELPTDVADLPIEWRGIATDPTSGTTYLFLQINSEPYFEVLDVGTGTRSERTLMVGVLIEFESSGSVVAADFEPGGVLWLSYGVNNQEAYHLLSYPSAAVLSSAEPADIGVINTASDGVSVRVPEALTYDPEALPATGAAPIGVLAAGGALLALGAVLAGVAGRRQRFASGT